MSARRPINPVIQGYVYPGDRTSKRRFWLIYFFVTGVLMFVGGPCAEIFLVQPLISLLLQDSATITPDTGCFNHRLANQTCADDVVVEYYFWNVTNAAAWLAGSEPPAYEELGPYAFASKEVRYNLSYSESWDAVEYTYHQYAEFLPDKSCPSCGLNDTFTSVNMAYLQFISAGQNVPPGTPDSETMVMSTLLPSSLKLSMDTISAFMGPLTGSEDPEALYNSTVSQWSACGPVSDRMDLYGLPTPFVKDSGVAQLSYHPEFCQFVVETLQNARPDRGEFRERLSQRGPRVAGEIAEILGLEGKEIREALRNGSSIAELAEAQGIDSADLVDAIVARAEELRLRHFNTR